MLDQPPERLRDVLTMGTHILAQAQIERPRLEAEILLAHTLGKERPWLFAHSEERLPPHAWKQYLRQLKRRARGEPLAYILGEWEFYGLPFTVTPDVLIPRPETETLVRVALDLLSSASPHTRVVDVGTGSGNIAITIAVHRPGIHIWATDISARALRVAQNNIQRHNVQEQVHLILADLISPLAGPLHLILANLPYVALEEAHTIDPHITLFEPPIAVWGGPQGIVYIRRLLRQAAHRLAPGGAAILEIGHRQKPLILRIIQEILPRARVRIHPDLAGHPRVVEIRLPQETNGPLGTRRNPHEIRTILSPDRL